MINPSAFGGPDADDPLTRVVVVVVVDALLLDDDPYVNLNAPSFDDDDDEGVAADDAPATVAALRDAGSVIFTLIAVVFVDTAPQMTRAAYLRPSHPLVPSPPPTLDARVVDVDDDVNRVEHNDVTPLAPIIIIIIPIVVVALLLLFDYRPPTRRRPVPTGARFPRTRNETGPSFVRPSVGV